MAKVGYIYNTPRADGPAADKEWVQQYGMKLSRGLFSGPLGKRKKENE